MFAYLYHEKLDDLQTIIQMQAIDEAMKYEILSKFMWFMIAFHLNYLQTSNANSEILAEPLIHTPKC